MNPLFKSIIIIVISSGIFTLLLNQIYKINPKIFSFIEKVPENWKGKWIVRWMVQLFLMIIVAVVFVYSGFNDTIGNIIIGFIIALTDLVFSKSKKTRR